MKKFRVSFEVYDNKPEMVRCEMIIGAFGIIEAMNSAQTLLERVMKDQLDYTIKGVKQLQDDK